MPGALVACFSVAHPSATCQAPSLPRDEICATCWYCCIFLQAYHGVDIHEDGEQSTVISKDKHNLDLVNQGSASANSNRFRSEGPYRTLCLAWSSFTCLLPTMADSRVTEIGDDRRTVQYAPCQRLRWQTGTKFHGKLTRRDMRYVKVYIVHAGISMLAVVILGTVSRVQMLQVSSTRHVGLASQYKQLHTVDGHRHRQKLLLRAMHEEVDSCNLKVERNKLQKVL